MANTKPLIHRVKKLFWLLGIRPMRVCWNCRDSVAFSRRKAEGAKENLESARSKLAELSDQTASLQARVRSLEAELDVASRFEP